MFRAARNCGARRRSMATLVELERDAVRPKCLEAYAEAAAVDSRARAALDPGHLGSFRVRAGRTSSIYHLSTFADWEGRRARDLSRVAPGLDATENSIFAEATATLADAGVRGLAAGGALDATPRAVFEMRTYALKLGYDTVPDFLALYGRGLVDKLRVDDSGASRLVTLLYAEAGAAPLNTVVELWRHESAAGSQRSREASRGAAEWRAAIGEIAKLAVRFETQLLAPLLP